MKKKLHKRHNAIIVAILALLGFSTACSKDDPKLIAMYASPYAEYKLSSKVTDQDENPIEGIQVDYYYFFQTDEQLHPMFEPVYSNGEGMAKIDEHTFGVSNGTIRVTATDIDGEQNGYFKPAYIDIPIAQTDFKDPEGWFWGTYSTPETIVIAMEEENTSEETGPEAGE